MPMPSTCIPQLSQLLFSLSFVIILCIPISDSGYLGIYCPNNGNYTANSAFQSNLNLLLSSLTANATATGFTNQTQGQDPDKVYGLALCRGVISSSDCQSCLNPSIHGIVQGCPKGKNAAIVYDGCMLRYSDQNFFSSVDTSYRKKLRNTENASNQTDFNDKMEKLMDNLTKKAAYSSGGMKLATGVASVTSFVKIYGMAQCTRDISNDDCYRCFRARVADIQTCCEGKIGAEVIGLSCFLIYETYPYFPLDTGINTTTTATTEGKKNETGVVLAIVIPSVIALILISTICICFWRRRLTKKFPSGRKPEEITSVESILFDLSTLRIATDNFSEVNKLGQGGFGSVYKGILPDRQEIAVKRLSTSSSQGLGELKNELVLVAKLQHRNLVRLLGVCLEEQEKLLVYEYVPNRSLDTFLFDPIKCKQLNWGSRYKIIGGIARGLLYLHEDSQLKIIHRDLKASNILLDADMNPKISDFGLARLFGGDQTQGSTSRVVGTFGYMAPEYAMHGHISIKSDVFSFGVLVLEIITGRKNSDLFYSKNGVDLLSYTWEHWTKGTVSEIIDPSLGEYCPMSEVLRCIQIGLVSVQEDMADRPNMSTIVLMLNSYSVSIQAPSRPVFCNQKSGLYFDVISSENEFHGGTRDQSSSKSIPMSPNEVSISELEPR